MPIRMEQDDPKPGGRRTPGGGSGNSGKWIIGLLLLLFRKPKIGIPLLLIGGVWYFFLGGSEFFQNAPLDELSSGTNEYNFQLGASLNEEQFDRAEVFEPLAYGADLNSLPRSASLRDFAPTPLHQGSQGSCVGWASAYAARTILEARSTGQKPNAVTFSPAFLYNQIHLDDCNGAYMLDAMQSMQKKGALPFSEFRYDESSCANYPDRTDLQQAQSFRIKGFNRLTLGAEDYTPDLTAIKQNLAQGAPVVIGAMVGGTFMDGMIGRDTWVPSRSDYAMRDFGGHAMCVIGYDDDKKGGAFQIMNSWGQDWGDNGFFWMRYTDFSQFVREAYGLFPMGGGQQDQKFADDKMAVKFGLYDMKKETTIPLRKTGDIGFRTEQPVRIGDQFKVLISNSIDCYTYILGQETDGSSYVLFPYTAKHSPYCGITGTRLFPKDYHLTPDAVGNRDYIALIVSKTELDINALNQQVNAAQGKKDYTDKVKAALAEHRIPRTTFVDGKTIAFSVDIATNGPDAVAMILEIEKK